MKRRILVRAIASGTVVGAMQSIAGCLNEVDSSNEPTKTSSETPPTSGQTNTTTRPTSEQPSATTVENPGHSPHPIDLTIDNQQSEKVSVNLVVSMGGENVVDKEIQIDSNMSKTLPGVFEYPESRDDAYTYLVQLYENGTKTFEKRLLVEQGAGIHKVRLIIDASGEIRLSQVVH